MKDILKLARIQVIVIILFVFFKFVRPAALQTDIPDILKKIPLSLPNYFEGIIGVLIITGLGLFINEKIINAKYKTHPKQIYIIAVIIAAVYVLTQEFKIHNLGGNNVYDPNDVLFSALGLVTGFLCILVIKPKIYLDT